MESFDISFAQIISVLTPFIAAILGGTALLHSMRSHTKALVASSYTEIDKSYFALLNIALQNPDFLRPETITSKEQKDRYGVYSFMVWNFLESIYDKCMDSQHLKETWMPIILTEGELHFEWFKNNQDNFKQSFCDFSKKLIDPSFPKIESK
ncbi:MAG: hypothetical protein ACJA02_000120 [Myxococcota bacterium]|jgi:hypothetical protein